MLLDDGRQSTQQACSVPWTLEDGIDAVPHGLLLTDEEAKACAMRDIADVLGVLNTGLNGRQFLLGDDYTLADTHLQSVVGWLGMLSVDMKPHSNVTAWLERCTERPALKKLGGSHDSE